MRRTCEDCGMWFDIKARNQKRCTPCRVLRDVEYWSTRGERSCGRCGGLFTQVTSNDATCVTCVRSAVGGPSCVLCSTYNAGLLCGTPVCVACFKSTDAAVRGAALEEARTSLENRRAYAKMPTDPPVPVRGSSEYEVMAQSVWRVLGERAPQHVEVARAHLLDVLGGVPAPQYIVMAATLEGVDS